MSRVQSCGVILLSRYDPPARKVSGERQIGHTSEPRSILPAGRLPCQRPRDTHEDLNTSTRLCILICVNGKRDPAVEASAPTLHLRGWSCNEQTTPHLLRLARCPGWRDWTLPRRPSYGFFL